MTVGVRLISLYSVSNYTSFIAQGYYEDKCTEIVKYPDTIP